MRISVVGLGKLGSPLASVLATKGHDVVGADLDAYVVAQVASGVAPVSEPGLQDLTAAAHAAGRLSATADVADAVRRTEVTFVVVPTPSDESGAFSLDGVLAATRTIGEGLRDRDGFHLVVVTSTVLPGATSDRVLPALEEASGRTCGREFGLCYNPEFIALGSVVRDMFNPDLILIGESDERSGQLLASVYAGVCENEPWVSRMSFANAELAKLAVNTFVTTKISYANMLAEICERIPGGDVDVVSAAIGRDSRIGAKYLRGAVGYGGPCFPRDNVALATFARRLGVQATLAEATDAVNRHQLSRLVDVVDRVAKADAVVGVLGLAYKPDTTVVEESVGVGLANELAGRGRRVVVHDPLALESANSHLAGSVQPETTATDVLKLADVVVITTPWAEYRQIAAYGSGRPLVIVDCWRMLDEANVDGSVELVRLGSAPEEIRAASSPSA
jgi:UDPglucose 6-dehydrogenase